MESEDPNFLKAIEIRRGKDLVEAAGLGNHQKLLQLLIARVSVDAEEYNKSLFYESKNYVTPLQLACEKNHLSCVETLIDFEADINARDRFDVSALHVSAQHGHYDCLKALLDAGADCSTPTKHSKKGCYTATPHLGGTTPLHLAAAGNHISCVKELILSGADYNAIDEKGRTSLYIAAELKLEECVLVHLKNAIGRDILSLPGYETGDTPLHFAVKNNMVECVKMLLKFGSDPNHLNHNGISSLHYAVSYSPGEEEVSEEIVRLIVLEGYNTDINEPDGAGFIPLHYACFNFGTYFARRPNLAKFLIAYGADTNIQNQRGCDIIETELRSPCKDVIILDSIVRSVLHPPSVNMNKLLQPAQPPSVTQMMFNTIEDMFHDRRYMDVAESKAYHDNVKSKCTWYMSIANKPRTLQHYCRYYIRKALGYQKLRHIKDLPVPVRLQKFLLLNFEEDDEPPDDDDYLGILFP